MSVSDEQKYIMQKKMGEFQVPQRIHSDTIELIERHKFNLIKYMGPDDDLESLMEKWKKFAIDKIIINISDNFNRRLSKGVLMSEEKKKSKAKLAKEAIDKMSKDTKDEVKEVVTHAILNNLKIRKLTTSEVEELEQLKSTLNMNDWKKAVLDKVLIN